MQWSQLKQRVEAQFTPKLQGRVKVWATRYRGTGEEDGRGWLTLDGAQIYSMADLKADADWRALGEQVRLAGQAPPGSPESDWTRRSEHFFTHDHFREDLRVYVQTGIDDLLHDECPLLRGLAMLDRRLGRRRFVRLEGIPDAHPFVRLLHTIRAGAERWPTASPPA